MTVVELPTSQDLSSDVLEHDLAWVAVHNVSI